MHRRREACEETDSGTWPEIKMNFKKKKAFPFRDGFAQLEMSIPERTKSVITITFNAYSPSGMLYFRGSEQSGDFIAVMLQNGYIVFKVWNFFLLFRKW